MLTSTPGTLGLLWLVVLAIAMSAVSLYYYLKVLKYIYVTDPSADAPPLRMPIFRQAILCFIALSVTLLGCAPKSIAALALAISLKVIPALSYISSSMKDFAISAGMRLSCLTSGAVFQDRLRFVKGR